MFLTKTRDADLKILQKLSDNDLKSICYTSKYGKKLYDDEIFWLNRLMTKMDIEEIRDVKGDFSYKELYHFVRKGERKRGILEAVRRNNVYLFRSLWDDLNYKYWEEVIFEIGKYSNKDIVTYILSKEDDVNYKYDIAGTLIDTSNEDFTWLLKTGILRYAQYIFCIAENPEIFPNFPNISRFLSRIKDEDYLDMIADIANFSKNLDVAKKILEVLITYKHKTLSKDVLKSHYFKHNDDELMTKFIHNL